VLAEIPGQLHDFRLGPSIPDPKDLRERVVLRAVVHEDQFERQAQFREPLSTIRICSKSGPSAASLAKTGDDDGEGFTGRIQGFSMRADTLQTESASRASNQRMNGFGL
jgi:hypothetical protein